MKEKQTSDFTGFSNSGIKDAIQNALEQAGEHARFEVIETRSSHNKENERSYQVTLTTFYD